MRLLFIILVIMSAIVSQAQQIAGAVKDENGNPLKGVTVNLVKAADTSSVKLAVTNTNGSFSFPAIGEGNYKVLVSHVGFHSRYSATFSFKHNDVLVPELQLSRMSGKLGNVSVVAKKPLVEVKADKTVLNVEGTINAVGSNALELLRKSPGILLDKDENIILAGKTGVQVYVDGRPTPLSGQELANYLKTLQSSQIEAIELIGNPSAKYEAAGNAGIVNIRLVRNKSLGTNGSVNAGWNMGITAKYNAGFSLNYRNKHLNIFSNYSYGFVPNRQTIEVYRTVLDSLFDQSSIMSDKRISHNYKIGLDYFLNKRNIVGIMVNGILANPISETDGKTFISNTITKSVDRILVADNSNRMKRYNANINLNYSYNSLKTSLSLNADKGSYDINSDQMLKNYYYNASGQVKLDEVIYHIISPAKIDINSFKADYEYNCGKGKLSIGAKTAWIKTDNDFQRFNVGVSGEELDKSRSNHFVYKENINAGYINFNRQYKKIMVQAGLRVENTVTEGISNGQKFNGSNYEPYGNSFSRAYTDFFPSAAITFNKNPMKQWSLNYSRR
ncbi:MAG: TonB-dependent receptor domain-containing protein, partial [Flavitalea sp.]